MQELMLDLYEPPESDEREKRPLVIWAHGGGFTGGDKQGENDITFAYAMSQRGYVVLSINYRLADKHAENDYEED